MDQPTPAATHIWDGDTVPSWLDLSQYYFDDGQLVIHHHDGEIRPLPGWLLVHWSDGMITVASPRVAERVYGTHGLRGRAERAEPLIERARAIAAETAQTTAAGISDYDIGRHDLAVTILRELDQHTATGAATDDETTTRVISLCEQWVKAGPPPLGTPMARWWDARLVELHNAILPPGRCPQCGATSQCPLHAQQPGTDEDGTQR